MAEETVGTITELWRYPVKSMLGERIDTTQVTAAGVAGDRAFALQDVESGLLASAKSPRRWARLLELQAQLDGPENVKVALPDGEVCSSREHDFEARLSKLLERDVKVLSTAPEKSYFEEWWEPGKNDSPLYGKQSGTDDDGQPIVTLAPSPVAPKGTFFDFSAIHLVTTSSLAALRAAYADGDIDVRRFRPNLVIEVPDREGYVENEWAQSEITVGDGGLALKGLMLTMRCVMTTLAQPGLPRDPGILQATNRQNRQTVPGMGDYACMGMYCMVTHPGPVSVGDTVRIV